MRAFRPREKRDMLDDRGIAPRVAAQLPIRVVKKIKHSVEIEMSRRPSNALAKRRASWDSRLNRREVLPTAARLLQLKWVAMMHFLHLKSDGGEI